jgi:hypothetical protein
MGAGLLALSRVERRRLRSRLTIAVVVASLIGAVGLAKAVLPITPASSLHAAGLDTSEPDLASTVGWISITKQMTAVYQGLPQSERDSTVIVSSDYGVAGALQIDGNPAQLPASFSPQLSDYLWMPSHLAASSALMVGYEPSQVGFMCASPTVIAHLTVPYHVVNLESGTPVTFCNLTAPLPQVWRQLRDFS